MWWRIFRSRWRGTRPPRRGARAIEVHGSRLGAAAGWRPRSGIKIHHGETEFTEVARNDTRGWTLSKSLGLKSKYGWGDDDGSFPAGPHVPVFWGAVRGLIGHPTNTISDAVIGAAIKVHRQLGPGLLEADRQGVCHRSPDRGVPHRRDQVRRQPPAPSCRPSDDLPAPPAAVRRAADQLQRSHPST